MNGEPTPPADEHRDAPPRETVEVDVARTGGFAGLTRRWRAEPSGPETPRWLVLIDRCPWDSVSDAAADAPGRRQPSGPSRPRSAPVPDGFVWMIQASGPGAGHREAEVPEYELTGAWRELVDAVRAWHTPHRES